MAEQLTGVGPIASWRWRAERRWRGRKAGPRSVWN